ncbi:MAG: TIGR00282 family metallophosphoesterase [Candidatus Omnitrophota bacterium]
MKILAIGDIVGSPGREAIKELLPKIVGEEKIDFVVANGENAAGGSGVTPKIAEELFGYGIDALTTGDHVWKKKEIEEVIATDTRLLRPANYPSGAPGEGASILKSRNGELIGVVCLVGRVFMQSVECPFRTAKEHIERLRQKTPIIVVDIHAEATSEKIALGWYLDGDISFLFGTHTHIQTADEKILPKGTAYITDLGMTGPYDSVLGRKVEQIIQRYVTQMPIRFEMAEGNVMLCGAIVDIDKKTGKATSVKRIQHKL